MAGFSKWRLEWRPYEFPNGNLLRVAKKTKRAWTYMRQNGVDSPYLFLHPGFSIVASLAHTEEFLRKLEGHGRTCGFAVFVSSLRL